MKNAETTLLPILQSSCVATPCVFTLEYLIDILEIDWRALIQRDLHSQSASQFLQQDRASWPGAGSSQSPAGLVRLMYQSSFG